MFVTISIFNTRVSIFGTHVTAPFLFVTHVSIFGTHVTAHIHVYVLYIYVYGTTGGLILLAMFMIYPAANDTIRYESFEIFFAMHHCFVLFFAMLLLHGPVYLWWGCIPLALYVWERRLQVFFSLFLDWSFF
jgi:hypothetical protein